MKKVTESTGVMNPESITDHIAIGDIPEFRNNLRELLDWGFLYCGSVGINAEPAWCVVQAVDQLLEMIYENRQSQLPISQSQTINQN